MYRVIIGLIYTIVVFVAGLLLGKKQGRVKGKAEGKAESALEIKKLTKRYEAMLGKLSSHDEYFKAIIAMEAVAVSCAACHGGLSDNKRIDISEFIKGMNDKKLPKDIEEKIQSFYDKPPSVKEAFLLAKKSGIPLDEYEDLIRFVMEIDGMKQEDEKFVQAWSQLKAA